MGNARGIERRWRALANLGAADRKDFIEAGWSVPKHKGSRRKASATPGSRLNQSNGVRAGMKEAFRKFSPGCADLASRASPSRVPDPDSTSPSIKSLCLRTYCCAAKDP